MKRFANRLKSNDVFKNLNQAFDDNKGFLFKKGDLLAVKKRYNGFELGIFICRFIRSENSKIICARYGLSGFDIYDVDMFVGHPDFEFKLYKTVNEQSDRHRIGDDEL